MRAGKWRGAWWCMGAMLLCAGCATTNRNAMFASPDSMVFRNRDYAGAARLLSGPGAARFYGGNERVLSNLDIGMLEHFAAERESSNRHLDEAERLIEENFTKSISNAAASLLSNDAVLEYSGEPYEDIYINVFKSLNYLGQKDFDGAFVEVRRVNTKLAALTQQYARYAAGMNQSKEAAGSVKAGSTEFHDSALAHFISMLMYRTDEKPDDARLDFEHIGDAFRTQPHVYNFPIPELSGTLSPGTRAKLDVIAFTGRAPSKRAKTLYLKTNALGIGVRTTRENAQGREVTESEVYIPFFLPGLRTGYTFKCQVPYIIANGSRVARIAVLIDGLPAGDLAMLESLENAAIETYKVKEPITNMKTVIRSTVKGIATGMATQEAEKRATAAGGLFAGIAASVLGEAANVAVASTEQADLRYARYLPARAYVGEFEVDPGSHRVMVQYFDRENNLLWPPRDNPSSAESTVDADAHGLNLVPSFCLE
jgi:hypothetical protein